MNIPMHFAAPPRRVPFSLVLQNVFNGGAQLGWLFFGFGMIFFWIFAGHADYSIVTFRGDIAETAGRVTGVEDTNASENDQQIVAHHYEYSVAGRRLRGTSYSLGSGANVGEQVLVEYKEDNPLTSRIAGMRRAEFGPWTLLVAIFPLIGLVILYFSTKGGIHRMRLLRRGLLTTGRLVDKQPTSMTVNDRRVYELTFEFTARDGRRGAVRTRSHDTGRLQDEAAEPLMYDPENLERAYVLDEIPSRPEIDGTGELVGRPATAVMLLIIPALVIGWHIWYFTV